MTRPVWDKVMFADYIAHFRSMTPKQMSAGIQELVEIMLNNI